MNINDGDDEYDGEKERKKVHEEEEYKMLVTTS